MPGAWGGSRGPACSSCICATARTPWPWRARSATARASGAPSPTGFRPPTSSPTTRSSRTNGGCRTPTNLTRCGIHLTSTRPGLAGADGHVTQAWDVTEGDPGTVVAVIDSGVDLTHPDLNANLWVNPGEIAGNAIDDDNNGFVDDVNGWDFYAGDNLPNDAFGHGTHVAGIVAAVANNMEGGAGVCPDCRIMALRAGGPHGSLPLSDILQAISYAWRNGADIINMSFGSHAWSGFERSAIETAGANGVLVVASAGQRQLGQRLPGMAERLARRTQLSGELRPAQRDLGGRQQRPGLLRLPDGLLLPDALGVMRVHELGPDVRRPRRAGRGHPEHLARQRLSDRRRHLHGRALRRGRGRSREVGEPRLLGPRHQERHPQLRGSPRPHAGAVHGDGRTRGCVGRAHRFHHRGHPEDRRNHAGRRADRVHEVRDSCPSRATSTTSTGAVSSRGAATRCRCRFPRPRTSICTSGSRARSTRGRSPTSAAASAVSCAGEASTAWARASASSSRRARRASTTCT